VKRALLLLALPLLVLPAQARAEYRVVLIEAKQEKGKSAFTIYSDDKQDRRSGASLDEAVKAIKGMQGWGSSVGVYFSPNNTVPAEDADKIRAAIQANFWLGLFQSEVPRHLRDHFRKQDGNK
jgi:hypothetical protein